MRIVVSGTHATGKSTLISDFSLAHPEFAVLPDPFEFVDDGHGSGSLVAQLRISAERLLDPDLAGSVIAERGPLDFLAYLAAVDDLGRSGTAAELVRREAPLVAAAMQEVDLLVLLGPEDITVPDEDDPELRDATAEALLTLADDPDLTGTARIVELSGPPTARMPMFEVRE